jgi:hypothetical protein
MRNRIALALVILTASLGMAQAQENAGMVASNPPSNDSLKPIDIQTFWSGDDAVANGYYYDGLPLQNPSDFEKVIDPLNDPQASGFLRSAADKDAWGNGLFWGGLGVEMAGWVDFAVEMTKMGETSTDASGNTTDYTPNLGPSLAMILAGNAGWVGGMLLQGDAGSDRYNAVNRYNYIVQHDDSLSMTPYASPDAEGLDIQATF